MFNISLIIKLIEDLRLILVEIETKKFTIDNYSVIRVSKSLVIALKVVKAVLKKETASAAKVSQLSDQALAKTAAAALVTLKKVTKKPSKVDIKSEVNIISADVKAEAPKKVAPVK